MLSSITSNVTLTTVTKTLLQDIDVDSSAPNVTLAIAASSILVGIVFFALLMKKFYYFFCRHKRFFIFPRYDVRGITNVSMVIAITVSVILLLILVTGGVAGFLFRAYPGTRVTFEIILVKISGLMFGPVIGLISGALIDLLTFSLSAGVFHYGYFISVSLMGLLAGTLRVLSTSSTGKPFLLGLLGTFYLVVITAIVWIVFYFFSGLAENGINVSLTGIVDLNLSFSTFIIIIVSFTAASIFVIWCIVLWWSIKLHSKKGKKNKANTKFSQNYNRQRNDSNMFKWLIISILISVSSTLVIYVTLLPVFDSSLDKQPYEWWLAVRMLVAIPLAILDILVVFPLLSLVTSFIKYDDRNAVYANIGEPLFYSQWNSDLNSIRRNKESLNEIINYGSIVKFNIEPKQIKSLEREFLAILNDFQLVINMDVEGVVPMDYPIENMYDEHRLREDWLIASEYVNDQEIISRIKNKKTYKDGQFVLLHFLEKK